MKTSLWFAAGTIALAAAAARAQDAQAPAPAASPSPAPAAVVAAPTDGQLVEEFGWFMAKRFGISDLQFTPAEVQALTKGITEALSGQGSPYDLQKVGPDMDAYMQKKQAAYLARLKEQNASAAADFFAKLKQNKAVVALPSGLCYEVLSPGAGAPPKPEDTVRVDYTGTLLDGTVFDTSKQPRQPGAAAEPAEFPLNGVISGWTEGMQKIGKGGRIKLYIPADLAYGDKQQEGIPPGSALIFDVELLDIKPAAAAAK